MFEIVVAALGLVVVGFEVRVLLSPPSPRRPRLPVVGRLLSELAGVAWLGGRILHADAVLSGVCAGVCLCSAASGRAITAWTTRHPRPLTPNPAHTPTD